MYRVLHLVHSIIIATYIRHKKFKIFPPILHLIPISFKFNILNYIPTCNAQNVLHFNSPSQTQHYHILYIAQK